MLNLFFQEELTEAGCDEAGRGCLAGPVVAAAVILPKGFSHPELNDSKQVSASKRDELRLYIEQYAIAFAVAFVDPVEIDEINILNASFLAMHRAIDRLQTQPGFLIIDGNRFNKYQQTPHQCIVQGDAKFLSIAAASILAKTYRDEYMNKIHELYPHYAWNRNKGYPTTEHRRAIRDSGITAFHRKSFQLLPAQLEIRF